MSATSHLERCLQPRLLAASDHRPSCNHQGSRNSLQTGTPCIARHWVCQQCACCCSFMLGCRTTLIRLACGGEAHFLSDSIRHHIPKPPDLDIWNSCWPCMPSITVAIRTMRRSVANLAQPRDCHVLCAHTRRASLRTRPDRKVIGTQQTPSKNRYAGTNPIM